MPEYSIVTESDYGVELGSCRATGTRAAIADFVESMADCVGSECEITRGDGVTVYNGELATDSQCAHSIDGKDVPSRVSPEPAPVRELDIVYVDALEYPASAIVNGEDGEELTVEDRRVIAHIEALCESEGRDVTDCQYIGDGGCGVTGLFGRLARYTLLKR